MLRLQKKLIIIDGLPRSGSTLLANILAQNSSIHATATSGILEMLVRTRNNFQEIAAFQAMEEKELEEEKINVLRGMLIGHMACTERQIFLDKSRGWLRYAEMLQELIGHDERVKILVCVRDLREVVSSFDRLWAKTSTTRIIPDERVQANYWNFETVEGRCNFLLKNDGIVGCCVNRIRDAVQRGWKVGSTADASLMFVDYDELTSQPARTIFEIYSFLDIGKFDKHDFNNVAQITREDDLVHVYKDLHTIRPEVKAQPKTWGDRLPKEYAKQLEPVAKFWKKLTEKDE